MIKIEKTNDGGLDKVTGERCSITAHRLGQKHWSVVIFDTFRNSLSLEILGELVCSYRPTRAAELRDGAGGGQGQQTIPCPTCGAARYVVQTTIEACKNCGSDAY